MVMLRSQPAAGGVGASSETKPQLLCDPSQNGRFADCPHRHSATAGLFVGISNSAPRESINLKGPSITSGPLARNRIVTSLIIFDLARQFAAFLDGAGDTASGLNINKTRTSSEFSFCGFCC